MNKLMRIFKTVLPIAAAITTIGCSNHIKTKDGTCLTCWNNPVTQAPINHDGDAKNAGSQNPPADTQTSVDDSTKPNDVTVVEKITAQEHQISFDVPVNVDIAFVKVKREFSYQTEQEIRQEWGSLASTKLQTVDYAYDATPSAYYHMRAARDHNGHRMNIDTTIEKKSESESTIIVKYWPRDPAIDAKEIGNSLKVRVENALGVVKKAGKT